MEKVLRQKACLVVLDDVWEPRDAAVFNVTGPLGRLLVTTRNTAVADAIGAAEHTVDQLTLSKALDLLALTSETARGDLLDAVSDVAEESFSEAVMATGPPAASPVTTTSPVLAPGGRMTSGGTDAIAASALVSRTRVS